MVCYDREAQNKVKAIFAGNVFFLNFERITKDQSAIRTNAEGAGIPTKAWPP